MNLKILLASFFLVFLAELGDKTQLTALAFSTSSRSPFSVFIGTSLALICTTALAVLVGEALTRVVPARVLQLISAVMFVLVGLVLLVNLARKAPAAEKSPAEGAGARPTGPLSIFIGRQAIAFEEDLATYIRETAPLVTDPVLREKVLGLEKRHRRHAQALSGLEEEADEATVEALDRDLAKGDHEELLSGLDAATTQVDDDAVANIIKRQEAAAHFYVALAQMIDFHDAKDVLRTLAQEELDLVQDLCAQVNHPHTPPPRRSTTSSA